MGERLKRFFLENDWCNRQSCSERLLLLTSVAVGVFLVGYMIGTICNPANAVAEAMGEDGTRTLFIVFAGIVGWYFLLRRTKAVEQTSSAAEKNAEVAERSAVSDQLVRATEQISDDSPAVRTGGILKLEQIASSHGGETARIIRILAARVCELAAIENQEQDPIERNRRQDIEVAIRVVSRFAETYLGELDLDADELGIYGDLQRTDLRGLQLTGCFLSFFQLQGADLSKANLRLTNFGRANLKGAKLIGANLDEVNLSDANLQGADFSGADLKNAILNNADLSGAIFEGAKNLTQDSLNEAYYLKGLEPPQLPDGLNPPQEEERDKDQGQ